MPKVHNKYHKTAPTNAVYIGRRSPWGNPFTVAEHGRERCIKMYIEAAEANPAFKKQARSLLRGKDLVCFCKPQSCHGDYLLRIANE